MRWVVLLVGTVALTAVTLLDEVGPHDEGLVLAAAGRVADGQLPWRDFWWNYGPGEPVLLGGLVALFGPSLLVWRIARALAGGVVALLAARLALRLGAGERWAWMAGAGAGSALAWPLTPGPNALALVGGLGAMVLAAGGRTRGAGAAAGVAVWLRPEVGVAFAFGAALAARRAGAWRERGRGDPSRATLGAAAVVSVVLTTPFVLAAPGRWAEETIGFLVIQDLQRLPLDLSPPADPNKAFEVLLPALLLAATAAWLLLAGARPLALLAPVLAGVAYLLGRADAFHLVPLAPVLAVALAVAASRTTGARRAAVALGLAVIVLHGVERQAGRLLHPPALAAVPGGVGDGVRTTSAEAAALRVVVPRLRALRRPLVVLPPRTDRVRFGNPLLNVVADLPNPTRNDVMQPGVVTRDDVQAAMVDDLRRTGATVVRWLDPEAGRAEDNGSGRERGSTRLDRFVAENYRRDVQAGSYLVLVPR